MATYVSATTSNGADVSDTDAVTELLETWNFVQYHGGIRADIQNGMLNIWGEGDFEPYREGDVGPDEWASDHADPKEFLKALLPHLDEPLIVQTVGRTKMRYPFNGTLYVADPQSGEVLVESFHDRYHEFLEDVRD